MLSKNEDKKTLKSYISYKVPCYYIYHIFSVSRWNFFKPKHFLKSRSILLDGSRSLGLIRKGETCIITKFQRTD